MSLTFYSDKRVNIKQLIDAGIKCNTTISKHQLYRNAYTMVWNVGDYEHYATEVLTNPDTQKAFRERIEPCDGDFVIERDFTLYPDGQLVYTIFSNADDVGILHRIFDVLGIRLIDEYSRERESLDDPVGRGDMSQEDVAASIDYEYIEELWNRRHELTESEEIAFIDYFNNTPPYESFSPFKLYDPSSSRPTPLLRSDMYQHEVALSVEVDHCIDDVDNNTGVKS